MTLLSLCMIVRDEEELLGGCLESARTSVDEMIVVDTGSRDATRQLAARYGARVFEHAWHDDFAAARNESLRHARGRWVLVLDADERLSAASARQLRGALTDARFDVGMLRLHDAARLSSTHDAVLSGAERIAEVQLVPRLLRRADGLAFVDRVHENVTPWLRRRGCKIAGVDADIIHYGATEEIVVGRKKKERNLRLLRERMELDPRDLSAAGYLAHELMGAGETEEAHALVERLWPLVELVARESAPSIHRLATARARLLLQRGDPAGAGATVEVARRLEGDNPDLRFLEAVSLEILALASAPADRARLIEGAREAYEACCAFAGRVFAQAFVVGATTWAPRLRLGVLALVEGKPAVALATFSEVLETHPSDAARLGCAEALLDLGRPREALLTVEAALTEGSADAWLLSAASAHALGRADDARLLARRAVQAHMRRPVAPHRRERLRSLATSVSASAASA